MDVENILLELTRHLKLRNIRTLAEFLEINSGTVYAWIKRGSIGNTGAILAKVPYINIEWLKTGTGPMMIVDKSNIDAYPKDEPRFSKVAATIEPGAKEIRQSLLNLRSEKEKSRQLAVEMEGTGLKHFDNQPISELMYMTSVILESSTIYKGALASNIRAFYQSVQQEGEMARMEIEMREMRQDIAELKELIIASKEDQNQKREQKAG